MLLLCCCDFRIILCIDVLFWFSRSLHSFSFVRTLGPKLFMIRRMLNELTYFMFIVIVFVFAYGVATQALMYHNQDPDLSLLKNVFFPAYFVIGGEYYEREKLMEVDECEAAGQNETELALTDRYTQDDCPEANGAKVSLGLLVVYLILLNILLVNLLIAIFRYSNALIIFVCLFLNYFFVVETLKAIPTKRFRVNRTRYGNTNATDLSISISTSLSWPPRSPSSTIYSRLFVRLFSISPAFA